MAHSIQENGIVSAPFNDLDLMVIICLANREASLRPDTFRLVHSRVAEWKAELVTYGPGTINLGLPEIIQSSESRNQLVALLDRVGARLEEFGDAIDRQLLNAECSVPGVTFDTYPTSLIKTALSKLKGLVS